MSRFLKFLLLLLLLVVILYFVALPSVVDRVLNRVFESQKVTVSEKAGILHDNLWIADLHADGLLWSRNLLKRNGHGHVDIPRLIEGNVALQAFTVVSKTPFGLNFESNDDRSDMITFLVAAQRWPLRTWFSLNERALYQAEKLHRFAEQSKSKFCVIKSRADLRRYMARRSTNSEITAGFLGLEGAQVLEGNFDNLRRVFDAGFRMMAPSHIFD
ncbi:membrane dipeptidase, partial [bacterium]|nr:membrane dipeptidase [bacterium]